MTENLHAIVKTYFLVISEPISTRIFLQIGKWFLEKRSAIVLM